MVDMKISDNLDDEGSIAIYAACFSVMTLVVLSTSTFMGVALSKFVRIVRQAEQEHDLNLGYIIVTAAGLAIWAGIWIALSAFEF